MTISFMSSGTGPDYPQNPAAVAEDAAFARICAEHGDASLPTQLSRPMLTTRDEGYGTRAERSALSESRRRVLGVMKSLNAKIEKAGSFTDDEDRAFNKCSAIMDHLTARIEVIDRTLDAGGSAAPSGKARSSGWRDHEGRHVRLLASDEKLADHVRSGSLQAEAHAHALGTIVRGLVTGDPDALAQMRGSGPQAGLVEGDDGQGGHFIASTVAAGIIDFARSQSVIFQAGAQTLPMTSPSMKLVKVDNDLTPGWRGEGQKVPQSEPPFGALTLNARKLIVHVPISSELVEDVPQLGAELDRLLAEALSAEIDRVALLGGGKSGEPTGVYNWPGVQALADAGWTWDSILEAQQMIEDRNHDFRSVIEPPFLKRTLNALKDTQGRFLQPPAGMEQLQRLKSTRLANDQALAGDFREMIVGMLVPLAIRLDRSTEAAKDTIIVQARMRADIGIARPASLLKFSNVGGV